jgi:tetratricopeptide (TPR) repeat protein
MSQKNLKAMMLSAVIFAFVSSFYALPAKAQTAAETNSLKEQAVKLLNTDKYTEALPILERLAKAEPDNADTQFYLGFALLAQAKNTKDKETARQLVIRARQSFVKAKQLGSTQKVLNAFIESLPENGIIENRFSKNTQADDAMQQAEAAFTQGKIDEALKLYQKALSLDPTIYAAALFSGDMYTRKEDFANAEIWYQKAIAIDPNRETAYRYSATPLMRLKKYPEARDRYIEAFISEPFNRLTSVGLSQWAEVTGAQLAHPKIEIPANVKDDGKGGISINLDAGTLLSGNKDDGSMAWIAYGGTRSDWMKGKFTKNYPNEKVYRHSLQEESEAIRSVLALVEADEKAKKTKNLNPSLAKLKELNDKGLLEAYILLARADQGIVQDYFSYLKTNRSKLRLYVAEYVVTGGGK